MKKNTRINGNVIKDLIKVFVLTILIIALGIRVFVVYKPKGIFLLIFLITTYIYIKIIFNRAKNIYKKYRAD